MSESSGIALILATAFASGFAIFVNYWAVKGFNPFVFTTLKNVAVAVALLGLIGLLGEFKALKTLTKKQWLQLAGIGLVGGSIPFLLYFWALQQTSAVNAGFLHKTLFVWATLFAIVFLREKIGKRFVAGAALLLAGNYLLFSDFSGFGFPEAVILLATVLWAAENVWAKHVLRETSGRVVAFGRMFFGSVFMLAFLAVTGQLGNVLELGGTQWQWVALTAGFLFVYVYTFYSGLKYVAASRATVLLLLAQPVTAALNAVFLGKAPSLEQGLGLFLIVAGVLVVAGVSVALRALAWKGFALAPRKG